MRRVLVMMATYNGEKYLREQLDSIYAQKGVYVDLLVRDDGSSDSTVNILEEYAAKRKNLTIMRGKNVRAAKSFSLLVKEACEKYRDYDYYSYSDQDDVWIDNKLLTAVTELDKSDNKYKFFECETRLVDGNLVPLKGKSIVKKNSSLASVFISSHSLGCTQTINLAILDLVNSFYSHLKMDIMLPFHDSVTNRIAWVMGAHIVQAEEALMLYRQHGHNVVGATNNKWGLLKARVGRLKKHRHFKSKMAYDVLCALPPDTPIDNLRFVENVANYRKNLISYFRLLFSPALQKLDDGKITSFIYILFCCL